MNKVKYVATIKGTGSSHPTHYYSTDEILNEINPLLTDTLIAQVRRLGVSGRYCCMHAFPQYLLHSNDRGKRSFQETTTTLALNAIKDCLAKTKINPSQIDLLIAATNTQDRPLPCLSFEIMSEKELFPKNINNLNLQNQGCSIMPKAMEIANEHLLLHPEGNVLIVLAEAHSLLIPRVAKNLKAFQDCLSEEDVRNTTQLFTSLLFGDGAVAILVGSEGDGLKVEHITHITNIEPTDSQVIHMDEGGVVRPEYTGLPYYHMTKDIPATGLHYAKTLLENFQKEKGHAIAADIYDYLLIHTGSKKILDGILNVICNGESASKGAISFEILQKYGNLSSASVPMMIHHLMTQNGVKKNQKILSLTFGVGFSGSIMELIAA